MPTDSEPGPFSTVDEPMGLRASARVAVDSQADSESRMLDSFREHWTRGERISAEDFVRGHAGADSDEEIMLDVVFAEYVAREELGERPTVDEYYRRFPKLTERLSRLFSVDEAMRDLPEAQALETLTSPRGPETTAEGGRIGKYLIVGEIGSGGQGKVYRAVHPGLAREVVIKLNHVRDELSTSTRDELRHEGRMLAEIDHPNLARVYDFDFHENEPFLVMEYVPGSNLEQHARQSKPTPAKAAGIVAKIARGLAAVHRKGVVHRDLKPRNIMIDDRGEPRLIDFGLALKESPWDDPDLRTESIVGTLAFMSPEQAAGGSGRVGSAADLFSLGGVLFYLLTDKPPFKSKTIDELLKKIVANDYDRTALEKSSAPERLKKICRKLLSTEPKDRYGSADEVANLLEAVAAPKRKMPWGTMAVAAVALIAVVFGAVATLQRPGKIEPGAAYHPSIAVEVKNRDGLFREINGSLQGGDKYKVRVKVPAGMTAALFALSDGPIERVAEFATKEHGVHFAFPLDDGKVIAATNKPGTEIFLAVGRRGAPIAVDEIRELVGDAWPKLPDGSLLRLQMDRLDVVQAGRGLDIVDDAPPPEEVVKTRLEALRVKLLERRFDYFEAFVLAHVE